MEAIGGPFRRGGLDDLLHREPVTFGVGEVESGHAARLDDAADSDGGLDELVTHLGDVGALEEDGRGCEVELGGGLRDELAVKEREVRIRLNGRGDLDEEGAAVELLRVNLAEADGVDPEIGDAARVGV